jgi:NAD(P)H dehydrogenase (quinone)
MKVFIVFAHPEKQSLTGSLLKTTVDELEAQGHEVRVSDLYEMQWKSEISRSDFSLVNPDARLKIPRSSKQATHSNNLTEDVKAEQEKLLWADLVIYQFPLWWYTMPAILKGWIDRVYSCGFAYGVGEHNAERYGERYGEGRLSGRTGMLVVTIGGWSEHYSDRGIGGPLEDVLYHMTHGAMHYVGMRVLPSYAMYKADRADDESYEAAVQALRLRLRTLQTTKPIAFRAQNAGDYHLPGLTLKPGLESAGATGFALHRQTDG